MSKTISEKELELKAEIDELKKIVSNLINKDKKIENISASNNDNEDDGDIPFRKFIKVMSLVNHKLALSTEGKGRGIVYHFTQFGEIQPIMYEDLSKIIHNQKRFAQNGVFFIMSNEVVKLHGLTNFYSKILGKDTIENILDLSIEKIKELFSNTTKQIQQTIVSIIYERLDNGEEIDWNKIKTISDIYGEDISQYAKQSNNN